MVSEEGMDLCFYHAAMLFGAKKKKSVFFYYCVDQSAIATIEEILFKKMFSL